MAVKPERSEIKMVTTRRSPSSRGIGSIRERESTTAFACATSRLPHPAQNRASSRNSRLQVSQIMALFVSTVNLLASKFTVLA